MALLLLEKRHVLTVVILFVVLVLLGFAGGYVLGYHHAVKAPADSPMRKLLRLPGVESAAVIVAEEYSMSSNEPGEHIDVDKPDVEASSDVTPDVTQQDAIIDAQKETASITTPVRLEISKIIDNASEVDAQYSIQVGLYGIKVNAERRVDELKAMNLSGHLTDFVNSKGDTLYNVRFGYFLDKASVLAALETYQQQHTGDGYVIRLKQ